MRVALRTLSRRDGDDLDSYLHVGAGVPRLEVTTDLTAFMKEVERRGLIEVARTRWREIIGAEEKIAMPEVGGRIVIPGSSVKGNVRARMELSFVPKKDGTVRSCFSVSRTGPFSDAHVRIWSRALAAERGRNCVYREGERVNVCLLCDLFGAQGLASLVEFSDLVGEGVKAELVSEEFGTKLAVAPPGSTFRGEIAFKNLRESELGLILLTGLAVGKDGVGRSVLFGRLKYRGTFGGRTFGRVRYQVESLRLSRFSRPLQDLRPGEEAKGGELGGLIERLLESAEREFGDEIHLVDEVRGS
ncbi:MAG: RAMP superfamily CRISPR-associated protein [Candidatus Caldarchaeales archaeon]